MLGLILAGAAMIRPDGGGSNDNGKTWFVEYDFTSTRKK